MKQDFYSSDDTRRLYGWDKKLPYGRSLDATKRKEGRVSQEEYPKLKFDSKYAW